MEEEVLEQDSGVDTEEETEDSGEETEEDIEAGVVTGALQETATQDKKMTTKRSMRD